MPDPQPSSSDPWQSEIRWLFQAAMLVFTMTVVIGILNGQQIVKVQDRDVRLAHVHSGTLGWITLSVLALCLWLFGAGVTSPTGRAVIRWLSVLAAVSVPCYVLAFLSGNLVARAVFGTPVLLAIAGFFVWIIARSRQVRLGVAHVAILAAVTTLTLGAVLGVLLQFQYATSSAFLPAGALAAHLEVMVIGYLVVIGMAISEWKLLPPPASTTSRLSRAGLIQIGFPFVGGLAVAVGALLNSITLLGLSIPCEIAGIGIYLWRLGPSIAHTRWLAGSSARHYAASGIFLVVNVILVTYLIGSFLSGAYPSFEAIPVWLIFALDHGMFIGVLTNALFGLIQDATAARRSFWPWADHVLFWGMNLGLVGFVLSLLSNSRQWEPYVTPIMGGSILLALLTYSIRLSARSRPPAAVQAMQATAGVQA